jgi:hypothetical protein
MLGDSLSNPNLLLNERGNFQDIISGDMRGSAGSRARSP